MQEFDAIFKLMLRKTAPELRRAVAGVGPMHWLDGELPRAQSRRADLVGRRANGDLVHLEIQSSNDPEMPLRMAEYGLAIYRMYGSLPRQILFYVGNAPFNMATELKGGQMSFGYSVVDARELEVDALLRSPELDDNLVAVLGRLREDNVREVVRHLLHRVGELAPKQKEEAYERLLLLAGLRRLERIVNEE